PPPPIPPPSLHDALPISTLLLSPNDPGLFFQLGLLKYNSDDFLGAARAFGQAVTLVPEYANAKYFLGLSLARLGETDLAIAQFRSEEHTSELQSRENLVC